MSPRTVYEIQGYQMSLISAGGVTLFASAQGDKKEGDFTVTWGQNAQYRELALGEGAARLLFFLVLFFVFALFASFSPLLAAVLPSFFPLC